MAWFESLVRNAVATAISLYVMLTCMAETMAYSKESVHTSNLGLIPFFFLGSAIATAFFAGRTLCLLFPSLAERHSTSPTPRTPPRQPVRPIPPTRPLEDPLFTPPRQRPRTPDFSRAMTSPRLSARVLDEDVDAAGMPRRLLRVPVPGQEPVIAVEVRDPSTGSTYYLTVPPSTRTCHEAVAWTFFQRPEEYWPAIQT